MAKQIVRYRTQWTAQFYVAAELTRREYLVSLTFGNAPVADLLVKSPAGRQFTVDVKGQSTRSFWLMQNRLPDANHYFILVYLPENLQIPRYFIVSSDELMRRREEYRQSVLLRGRYRDDLGGMNWSTAYEYEAKWENLPA